MTMPRKPTKMAVQRLALTFSAKNRIDSNVAKIGTVNKSIVTSAREIILRPVNTQSMPRPPIPPRRTCNLTEDVVKAFLPCQKKTGKSTIKTSAALKRQL